MYHVMYKLFSGILRSLNNFIYLFVLFCFLCPRTESCKVSISVYNAGKNSKRCRGVRCNASERVMYIMMYLYMYIYEPIYIYPIKLNNYIFTFCFYRADKT